MKYCGKNLNSWLRDLNISYEFTVLIVFFQQHRIRDAIVAA